MIAVAFSLIFALYIVGPDLASRLILGFVVPRRVVPLTRGEEISRAVVWCIITLAPAIFWAWGWAWLLGGANQFWRLPAIKTCFAGIYSEQFFRDHQGQWFHATQQVLELNGIILWRVYTLIVLISAVLNLIIWKYSWWRKKGEHRPWLRHGLAIFVLPRVAPWHVLFSGMLLPEKDLDIHVDILTKSNVMYQGRFADRQLSGDGSLVSITLAEPRRFQREQYLALQSQQQERSQPAKPVRQNDEVRLRTSAKSPVSVTISSELHGDTHQNAAKAENFWRDIPTNLFIVLGSEISNINLRYVPTKGHVLSGQAVAQALKQVQEILSRIQEHR